MKKQIRLLALLCCLALSVDAQVKRVEGVCIVVSEMEKAVQFYTEVLSFKKISDREYWGADWENLYGVFGLHIRKVQMQLGDETVELIDYLTAGGRSIAEDFKSNDLSFQHIAIVVSNMDSAYKILHRYGVVHVSTAPQTLPVSIPEAAGISAFYFQDPDRHILELIYFPKGKGQDKWQQPTNKIFLGIDHTAIGVSNTDSSHRFYHNLLGFERKGDSWNKGYEQAHLNNIENASLHITGYRSGQGPGVEFLQYLSPGPGNPYPVDSKSNDLWHWLMVVYVDDAEKLYSTLKGLNEYCLVSKKIVSLKDDTGILKKAFVARDPDGHAVLITEDEK